MDLEDFISSLESDDMVSISIIVLLLSINLYPAFLYGNQYVCRLQQIISYETDQRLLICIFHSIKETHLHLLFEIVTGRLHNFLCASKKVRTLLVQYLYLKLINAIRQIAKCKQCLAFCLDQDTKLNFFGGLNT